MKEERRLIVKDVEEMLRKEAIAQVQNNLKQFLCSIFVVPKKSADFRPTTNLKKLKFCVGYNHFKLERILILNELLNKMIIFTK